MTRTELNLVCLIVSMVLIVFVGVGVSYRRLHEDDRRPLWIMGCGMGIWLLMTALAARSSWIQEYDVFPPPAARLLIPSLLLIVGAALSPIGRRLAQGLKWSELVGFQAFRLPVELILYGFFFEARVPLRMTFAGSNYDVLTAISALILAPLIWRGFIGVKAVWIWNVAGLGLLINIVVLAVLSAPGGLDRFQIGLVNTLPFRGPSVWIIFCVLLALFGHLITFRKLLSSHKPA